MAARSPWNASTAWSRPGRPGAVRHRRPPSWWPPCSEVRAEGNAGRPGAGRQRPGPTRRLPRRDRAAVRRDRSAATRAARAADRRWRSVRAFDRDRKGGHHRAAAAPDALAEPTRGRCSGWRPPAPDGMTPLVFLLGLLLAAVLACGAPVRTAAADQRALPRDPRLAARHADRAAQPALLARPFEQALRRQRTPRTSRPAAASTWTGSRRSTTPSATRYGDELLTQVGPRLYRRAAPERHRGPPRRRRVRGAAPRRASSSTTPSRSPTSSTGRLERRSTMDGVDLDVEASIGVVLSGEHGEDATTLLQRADIAMYVAKRATSVCLRTTRPATRHTPAKLALLGELRRGHRPATSWSCTTSPRSASAPARSSVSRPWCAGSIRQRGLIYPRRSSRSRSTPGLIGPLTRHVLDSSPGPGPHLGRRRAAAAGVGQPVGPQPARRAARRPDRRAARGPRRPGRPARTRE